MAENISIHVPEEDKADLKSLMKQLDLDGEPFTSRAFDAVTLSVVLVPLTIRALPVLKAWLLARSEARRSTKVTIDGQQFEGYSADEVVKILESTARED